MANEKTKKAKDRGAEIQKMRTDASTGLLAELETGMSEILETPPVDRTELALVIGVWFEVYSNIVADLLESEAQPS